MKARIACQIALASIFFFGGCANRSRLERSAGTTGFKEESKELRVAWQTVDEGFRFKIPEGWKKVKVRGIDSHVGLYRGKTAYLEFDHVYDLGFTALQSDSRIAAFRRKESDPKLLELGEEIWRVNGRIASFVKEKADQETYGHREYKNVARIFIPFEGKAEYLRVLVFFKGEEDLPIVRKILQSFEWPES